MCAIHLAGVRLKDKWKETSMILIWQVNVNISRTSALIFYHKILNYHYSFKYLFIAAFLEKKTNVTLKLSSFLHDLDLI